MQNTTLPASGSIMQTLSLKGELHSHRCCQQQSIAHSPLMRAEPPHNFFSAQWKNLQARQFFKLPQDIATALLMLETSTIRVQTPAIFSCFTMQFEEKTPHFGYKIKYVSAEKLRTKKAQIKRQNPKENLVYKPYQFNLERKFYQLTTKRKLLLFFLLHLFCA